jgi:iron complex outermembrane recepter protein
MREICVRELHKVGMFTRNGLAAAVALSAAVLTSTASAQGFVLEEIVVTAQKRAQSLQDVPISVAAVSGEQISNAGITGLEELSLYTPNVNINQGKASPNLYIRGIGSGTNSGFEQSVGMYVDGVYAGRGQLSNVPTTMDLERVEILKGPQGILFGKNTIGGAINVTSAKPTDEFESYIEALYEPEHGEEVVTGVVSGPLTETVSGRLAVRKETFDGWWDDVLRDEQAPDRDNWYSRASLSWMASDTVEVLAKYEHGDFSTDETPIVVYQSDQPLNFQGDSPFPVIDDNDKGAKDFSDSTGTRTDVFALTINADVGESTFTSISSYSAYDMVKHSNADMAATAALNRVQDEEYKQLSQEFRLVSPGNETVDWIVGGYYQKSELDISRTNVALDYKLAGDLSVAPLVGAQVVGATPSIFDQESESWAAFGQATWNINEEFRVSAGLRYNQETKELDKVTKADGLGVRLANNAIILAQPIGGGQFAIIGDARSHSFTNLEREEDKVTWSTNAQWDITPDAMLYASVGTGYKGGGYDEAYSGAGETIRLSNSFAGVPNGLTIAGNDASQLEYDEETVLAYELGAKLTLADGAANVNIAIFRMEYDDLQVSSLVGDNYQVSNAGSSISQGIEIDGRWRLTERLTVGGAVAYLDAYYDEFNGATCTIPQSTDPLNNPGCLAADGSNITAGETGGQDLSGETLTFAPDWSANLNVAYVYPLGAAMELRTHVDVNYTDEFYSALDLDPNTKHDSYTKVNARIALASSDDKWSLALVGKNLTDKKTTVWNNDVPLTDSDSYFGVPERPRSIAIQGRYRFD